MVLARYVETRDTSLKEVEDAIKKLKNKKTMDSKVR